MILSKPLDKGDLVDFNVTSGTAGFNLGVLTKPKGTFHLLGQTRIAIYCQENTLILQINTDKWILSSRDVELRYFHDIASATTCFEVRSQEKSVALKYEAWWAAIPGFEPIEPEMDEDEDFLAYVFAIWQNKQLQRNLISCWA